MRCTSCHRNIAAGAEAAKMIVEYRQTDGSTSLNGYMMPDGPITAATGAMLRGWHSKCYWISKKREAKGDAVTGRVVQTGITGYSAMTDESHLHMTAKLDRLRTLAESMGRGVGDAQVTEAFNASERGGPYTHQHQHRLDVYQLIAHLEYAHDIRDQNLLSSQGGLLDLHIRLHAQQVQADIRAWRQADGEDEQTIRDWRTQYTAEIEQESAHE